MGYAVVRRCYPCSIIREFIPSCEMKANSDNNARSSHGHTMVSCTDPSPTAWEQSHSTLQVSNRGTQHKYETLRLSGHERY